ncbi:hypothetical protein [Undibacterium pigrum]|uniref:Integral membrane protein n=1 Tax=Undibacterium pigrum TaxID=401470 RepID=A0A318IV85_9BURK|nr:hypothetical protein [Undibacterium pigrum]PXX37857.1 hypothetical protein DFR42_11416 [Undibacterium pigrum]
MSTASDTSAAVKLHAPALSLRTILALDALTGLAMGLLLVAAAGLLSGLLGLPRDFLFMAGASLFPVAALVGFTSRAGSDKKPPAFLVWVVILGNLGWVIASILTMEVWFEPTVLGFVFVSVQAVVVLAFSVLEYRGLRG